MSVSATISSNNAKTASINTSTAGAQRVSITLPSAQVANTLRNLADVDVSTLNDGAMIQWDGTSQKFVTRNEISTPTGSLIFNGGVF